VGTQVLCDILRVLLENTNIFFENYPGDIYIYTHRDWQTLNQTRDEVITGTEEQLMELILRRARSPAFSWDARRIVIESVLATDMAKHFETLSRFGTHQSEIVVLDASSAIWV